MRSTMLAVTARFRLVMKIIIEQTAINPSNRRTI